VTIAHSNLVGLVRDGKLLKVISSENQNAPCWLTLSGNSLFCANTPSKSISRYEVSDNNINLAKLIAAKTQGEPTDIDALEDVLAAIEFGEGGASLSQYEIEDDGDLEHINTTRVAPNANGVVVIRWPFSNFKS
jgi:hypothetical protein